MAEVEYELDIDPTLARVNVTLFGGTYEDLIVKDGEGLLLDYRTVDGVAAIDVLGSGSITVSYSTPGLTNKTGPIWVLYVDVPIDAIVQLPEDATVISLNPTPLAINIVGDAVSLTMPAGAVEVTYTLGLVGTREHARALINDAEATVEEIKAEGVKIGEAEALLQQARAAYDEAQYTQAEQLASGARASALETRAMSQEAEAAISDAETAIEAAEAAGRMSLLDEARGELQQANRAYASGDYQGAKSLAERAIATAQSSRSTAWFASPYVMGPIAAVIVALSVLAYMLYRRPMPVQGGIRPSEDGSGVALDAIFEQNPHLRLDEKEVIRYVSELGGGVFASELRQRFDMPRSSAWRMIRRLEEQGIIETKTVGRETFVQIKARYRVKNRGGR